MEAYSSFAKLYDSFMDNIPYEKWAAFIIYQLETAGIHQGSRLGEMACGTGRMSRILANAGYSLIASDISADMLSEAMDLPHEEIFYVQQDMRELDFADQYPAIICVCDGLNYMRDIQDLEQAFSSALNNLENGGLFICDMKSLHFYRDQLGRRDICENRENASFIWENYFDEKTKDNQYDLTFYTQGEDGRYDRTEESHIQHAFTRNEIELALQWAGFENVCFYDDYTDQEATTDTLRFTIVAQKPVNGVKKAAGQMGTRLKSLLGRKKK